MTIELDDVLTRSRELHRAIEAHLNNAVLEDSSRSESSFYMCTLSLEHGAGLRALISQGNAVSATALMRLQYEALVRGIWIEYAANEAQLEKICQPLTLETEQAAKSLPGLDDMLKKLENTPSAPQMAVIQLVDFKRVMLKALNSYVHGGLHPLRRHAEGFPIPLAIEVVRNSNGLATMAGMMMALLTRDPTITQPMRHIQLKFHDCLPQLLYPAAKA
ncbi:hypothetical protein PKB_0837 [Pseudomonas knackmussii B13]|uniref:Uncharacterized protein n=1 Tax=Pseudomonas knackmussii (strain DSM 6978 / CCUG 54928 / LMG 23759 / B13) TaxID=1301098 RepID=A0A024HAV9_PSEKB|nr:hypothetical protein [Pseudomonas knackmussii]CDF82205.1 hypothetical protein PKB_0837 [Pseudomonas knackmussii B13]